MTQKDIFLKSNDKKGALSYKMIVYKETYITVYKKISVNYTLLINTNQ